MYDFIIVGGGIAGSVVASRLADRTGFRILVLEAGPDASQHEHTTLPSGAAFLHGSDLDWNYLTEPQTHLDGKPRYNCAIRALGGGSVINSGGWIRGDRQDYDEWARMVRDERWSYEGMLPYFKRCETHWDAEASGDQHGFDGPIHTASVSSSGRKYPLRDTVREAWEEMGFRFRLDGNDGSPQGIVEVNENWRDGKRQIASVAYGLARKRVEVLTNTLVSRIIFDEHAGENKPRAIGVECVDGRKFLLNADGEVIISAGAYRTPQLLLLSGIGATRELKEHKIKTVVELPPVGKTLHDHTLVFRYWKLRNPESGLALGSPLFNDPAYIKGGPGDWLVTTPVPVSGLKEALEEDEGRTLEDDVDQHPLVKGPRSQIELGMLYASIGAEQIGLNIPLDGTAIMTFFIPFLPTSRGSITLRSPDPEDAPVIDPSYYATEVDQYVARHAWRMQDRLMIDTKMKDVVGGEIVPKGYEVNGTASDEQIDARIKIGATTAFHPAGTAAMGRVVNSDLKVKGVDALRIVDASVVSLIMSEMEPICG